MEDRDPILNADEGEETMVSPRFGDEETVLARPVVPLEEVGDAHSAPTPANGPATTPLYSRLRTAPRRSLVAALVLVSALAGSVLGVAGLYFYQNHRGTDAPATQQPQQQQAEAPAPAAQETPAPADDTLNRQTAAPAPTPAEEPDAQADDDDDADSAKGRETEEAAAAPVPERRSVSESREATPAPKRGRKGDRDEEVERAERRPTRHDDEDDRPLRAEERDGDRREARRVGVITYRPRRVRDRRGPYGDADRLRRIFEGQP